LCVDCAKSHVYENVEMLMLKRGPGLKPWRRRVAQSVGAVLIDDLPAAARELLQPTV